MSFAENNYSSKKDLYASVVQSFENYKYGMVNAGGSWNRPIEQLKGVTMRLLGEDQLELTYHSYETNTVEGLERIKQDNPGAKFLGEVVKALKKEFKNTTGKTLSLKQVKENPVYFEKAGRVTAESSWMLGSSRYGHGSRPVGRYLCRTSCVYEFDASL